MSDELNFICPFCKKSVEDLMMKDDEEEKQTSDEEIDVILEPESGQFYHISCSEKQKEIDELKKSNFEISEDKNESK